MKSMYHIYLVFLVVATFACTESEFVSSRDKNEKLDGPAKNANSSGNDDTADDDGNGSDGDDEGDDGDGNEPSGGQNEAGKDDDIDIDVGGGEESAKTDLDTNGNIGLTDGELKKVIDCTPKVTKTIPWNQPNGIVNGNVRTFTKTMKLKDIDKEWPNWSNLYTSADGAPNKSSYIKLGPIEFRNPANGTYNGDDTYLRLHRDGKWVKSVGYPAPVHSVETGKVDDLPLTLEFRVEIAIDVATQGAVLTIIHCENNVLGG